MAEILSLPYRADSDGARRLAETLTAAIEEGRDLGSRGTQIRDLGRSMEALAQALRDELVKLGGAKELDVLADQVERLAHLARSYQDSEPA